MGKGAKIQHWRACVLAALSSLLLTAHTPAIGQVTVAANQDPEFNSLFQQTLRNPADVSLALRFAAVATRLGDYEAAIGTLERVLFYAPDLPAVQLDLGYLYYRMGSYESARTYFAAAARASSLPAVNRDRANEFLADIERRLSPHQWSVNAQAGLRYQSNVDAGPNGALVLSGGVPGLLDPRFRKEGDYSVFARGIVQHIYDFESQSGHLWETTLSGYASRQFEISRADLGFLELLTGPRLAIALDGIPQLTLRPYAVAAGITLGDHPYLTSAGAGIGLSMPLGNGSVESFVEVRERRFTTSADYPTVNELTGSFTTVGLNASGALFGPARWYARLAYRRAEARNDAFAFDSIGFDIGLPLALDSPFGSQPWLLTPVFGVTYLTYEAPNPLIDSFRHRRDQEFRVGALLDMPVHSLFGFSAEVQYTFIESSLPNYETDNLSIMLGPTIRF